MKRKNDAADAGFLRTLDLAKTSVPVSRNPIADIKMNAAGGIECGSSDNKYTCNVHKCVHYMYV